jgi:hypothetical protein
MLNKQAVSATNWSVASQAEHPVLGSIWHMVHPCETSAVMQHVNAESFMIAWLSIVLPLFGRSLSLSLALAASAN